MSVPSEWAPLGQEGAPAENLAHPLEGGMAVADSGLEEQRRAQSGGDYWNQVLILQTDGAAVEVSDTNL